MNKKIILSGLGLLFLGYFTTNHFIASAAEARVDGMMTQINQKNGDGAILRYDDISASGFGSEITIEDIQFNDAEDNSIIQVAMLNLDDLDKDSEFPGAIIASDIQLDSEGGEESESVTIGSITLEGLPTSRDSEFPEHLMLSVEDLVLTLPEQKNQSAANNQYLDKLIALNSGIEDALLIDTKVEIDYDAEDKIIETKTSYNMDELFSVDMGLKMQGVEAKKDIFRIIERNLETGNKASLEQLLVDADNASLDNAVIEFHNEGFVEIVWIEAAKQEGLDVEQYKQKLLTELEANSKAVAGESPDTVASINEIKAFIEDPESLSVSISPDEAMLVKDMLMSAIRNPKAFVAQLNIQVKAN